MIWGFLGVTGDTLYFTGWLGLVALGFWCVFSPLQREEKAWLLRNGGKAAGAVCVLGAALAALCMLTFVVYLYWWTIRWLWAGLSEILPLP